jgi:D-glucuronyl C5-epimerase C-terminus
MFRSPRIAVAAATALAFAAPAAAQAARPPLLVVGKGGQIHQTPDRLPADLPIPVAGATTAAAKKKQPRRPFTDAVNRMLARHQISANTAADTLSVWRSAVAARGRLHGSSGYALGNAIDAIVGIASRGSLTPSRLPLMTLTAQRNAEYFKNGQVPSAGQRVKFDGSDLVWQYYPGQGLQLQELASFGIANGLWRAKLKGHLRTLLDELVALKANRSGGVAWEYAFSFGGGNPPWASGMTQATAVQALSRGAAMLNEPKYAKVAQAGLALFTHPSPSGVRQMTARGPWYLMYSFDPSLRILNGFLQSLIGLDEMRNLTQSPLADQLFRAAEPVARAAVPEYRSSGWSYYIPGKWDTLDYHDLTTGFLEELCRRTSINVYCSNGAAFRGFLLNPPVLKLVTHNLRQNHSGTVRIWVSKPANVTLTIKTADGRTVAVRGGSLLPGPEDWTIHVPKGTGPLTASITATDDGGHTNTITAMINRH